MNPYLDFLLSVLYDHDGTDLHPPHLADLQKSGITPATIAAQKIRDVPPADFDHLLGFQVPTAIRSMLLIPFADPRGGWMDFVRVKVFPPLVTPKGTTKYLQRRDSGCRIFFPVATLDRVLHSDETLWAAEGEKKALALAQLDLAAIGFTGIDAWHPKGSQELLPDFDDVGLRGRLVKLVPDGDAQANPRIRQSAEAFAAALQRRGREGRVCVGPGPLQRHRRLHRERQWLGRA